MLDGATSELDPIPTPEAPIASSAAAVSSDPPPSLFPLRQHEDGEEQEQLDTMPRLQSKNTKEEQQSLLPFNTADSSPPLRQHKSIILNVCSFILVTEVRYGVLSALCDAAN